MKRVVAALFFAVAVVYAVPGIWFWAMQDAMVFPAPSVPRSALDAAAKQAGAEVVTTETADGIRLYGWHLAAPRPAEAPARVLLFFHGNAETVPGRPDLQRLALEAGWDLVVFAYRGYPGSGGSPSEAGLREDARAAWRYVTGDLGVAPGDVVLHGKSLGGGVAAGLAAEVAPRALVLESTFTSVRAIGQATLPLYPVGLLLRHPFDTAARVPRIKVPVLVLHGDADEVIPVSHGQALAKMFPGARYVEVPGAGHAVTLPAVDADARSAWLALLVQGSSGP